jgi:NAD+ diphosphatase
MIQDIHPHVFSNIFIETGICDHDYVFHFKDDALLLRQCGEELKIPVRKEFKGSADRGIFLFSLNNINCFLVNDCIVPDDPGYGYHEISFFRTLQQIEIAWASIVALQLMNWYMSNRFCGKCGSAMVPKKDERALACTGCENIVYPKISPAIIVAILSRDKILLARGTNFRGGFYSLVAGYADIGESLEEAVAREVKEEVGLDVRNIRYYGSQPWPLSGSMMIGFVAEADDHQPIKIDPKEIGDAGWYTRDNLPNHPTTISIAGEMIEKFGKGILTPENNRSSF